MSNIRRIAVMPLEAVLDPARAYGHARGLNFRRGLALFEVETDDGVTGYGEALGPVKAIAGYLDIARPFFEGRSIHDFELIAATIANKLYHFGPQNHLTACLSGVSVALADAIGKTLGVAVHDLLGGRGADRLPCYATTGYFTEDGVAGFERQLAETKSRGFSAAKIKIGAGPTSDVERVRLARELLGGDALLMVDCNGNYTPDIAYECVRKIEPFDIHWIEEPVPPTDLRGYAELRARAPIPVAGSEAWHTVHDFKRAIDARAIDIAMPSVTSCGGFGQAKQIAQLALMNNLRVSPSVWGTSIAIVAALHFAASLPPGPHAGKVPYPVRIEYDIGENPLRDGIVTHPPKLEDGGLAVPAGPGLGIEIDIEAVERFRVG
jgi:D-galactarolactone cycloisomerase